MKYCVAICLLALTASIKADGGYAGLEGLVYAPGHASADYYAYPKYAFEYAVKDPHTGDNKAQWEKRDGDVVKGAYSLVEPDGSLRVVEYWADDKSGFNAVVKRIGPNLHPTGVPAAPIYKAAIPVLASEHIAPISVGPIAKYEGLLNAPLLSGPAHGYAVSSASLYKDAPILKAPILPEPYIPAPVIDHAPIGPAFKGQIFSGPYLPGPIYKAAPIYSAPLPVLPSPIIKSGPALAGYDGHSGGYDGRLGGYDGPSAGYGGQSAGYGGLAAGYGGRAAGYGGRAAGYDGNLGGYGGNLGGYGGNLGGYGGHSISPLSSGLYKGGVVDLGHELLDNGYGYGKGPLLSGWGGLSAPYNGYKH